MLLPRCLTAACPWCSARTLAPVGTPLPELERVMEMRCGRCGGGFTGRTRWAAFLLFAGGVALSADLPLGLAASGLLGIATPVQRWQLAAVLLLLGVAVVALAAFLIANTAVRPSRPPRG